MTNQNDGLFLLEVLIDKIVFVKSPCFSDKDFRTCVNIQCPGVEPLEICDDEPGACIAKSTGPFIKSFNNGKSCLFSLTEGDISKAMTKYPIKVSVYKSLPCGCLPTKITMGECEIDMTKEFVEARKTFLEDPTNVSYQALKDSFRIVGSDGTETGEVVMFLRISCFGKLIITKFQGPGGPPSLGAERGSAIVDRSCAPNKDFQSMQDPCACGAARGSVGGKSVAGQPCNVRGGSGVCPPARDPYNSMPCEDPDDPCYCSGPKSQPKEQMVCRNTDQYCLHVPKGTWLKMPYCQELKNEQSLINNEHDLQDDFSKDHYINETQLSVLDYLKVLNCVYGVSSERNRYAPVLKSTSPTVELDKCSMNILNKSKYDWGSYAPVINLPIRQTSNITNTGLFGIQETSVYMTVSDNICRSRTSSTQATASINKCFQVSTALPHSASTIAISTDNCSTSTVSTLPYHGYKQDVLNNLTNPKIYFFGRKKDERKQKGMGPKISHTRLQKTSQTSTHAIKSDKKSSRSSLGSGSNTSLTKSKPKPRISKGAATNIGTSKSVTIKDEKQLKPCPALGGTTKGDMMVTVSHIRIGPKETCPVHGNEPCQGPKCVLASSGEEQGPVKVTSVNNPRRGVFEIVIRKLTGAPLAKNELMLEWTPPPSRPPTCSGPCPMPCLPSGSYRPSKCKLVICRPAKQPKCCKKKPCGRPCHALPCKSCNKCCKPICCGKPCKPCPPPSCCPPSPCSAPCGRPACAPPCKSSPCLRPCPIGRKRHARRSRSQPKIKSHHKRVSPCCNRSKTCPVVRCRSVPDPCIGCCPAPPLCLPRKCCSTVPCKSPKACASACSTCCV